jgi:hypothetical protein
MEMTLNLHICICKGSACSSAWTRSVQRDFVASSVPWNYPETRNDRLLQIVTISWFRIIVTSDLQSWQKVSKATNVRGEDPVTVTGCLLLVSGDVWQVGLPSNNFGRHRPQERGSRATGRNSTWRHKSHWGKLFVSWSLSFLFLLQSFSSVVSFPLFSSFLTFCLYISSFSYLLLLFTFPYSSFLFTSPSLPSLLLLLLIPLLSLLLSLPLLRHFLCFTLFLLLVLYPGAYRLYVFRLESYNKHRAGFEHAASCLASWRSVFISRFPHALA